MEPASGSAMLRIFIVEDQPAVRKGLRMLLEAQADLRVVGEASDCETALERATPLRPDVILMDLEMPHVDGFATAETLHLVCPQASIVLLSFRDDAPTRARAQSAGAAAFVTKAMPPEVLLTTLRRVSRARSGSGE